MSGLAANTAPEAVYLPAVADRLAAVWVAGQEDELAGRQGMVQAVALPAAWVFGPRSRCFVMPSCGERHREANLPQEFNSAFNFTRVGQMRVKNRR